jgi:hypothetical protein
LAWPQRQRRGEKRTRAVERHCAGRACDRHPRASALDPERPAHQHELDRARARRVADERVCDAEREPVHGARTRHAVALVAEAPRILQRGHRPASLDHERRHATVPRPGSPRPAASSSAAQRAAGTGSNAHPVAGLEQEHRIAARHEAAHRRAPEKMPAARRLDRSDQRLHPADRDRAGRRLEAGNFSPGGRDGRVETAEIREARQEADHVDAVDRRRVAGNDFGRGEPVPRRHILKVDAVFAAIDDRDAPEPAFDRIVWQVMREAEQSVAELRAARHGRVVMDEQRAVGRNGLHHARQICRARIQCEDLRVEPRINRIAELDRKRGVAAGENAGCHGHGHRCAPLRPSTHSAWRRARQWARAIRRNDLREPMISAGTRTQQLSRSCGPTRR